MEKNTPTPDSGVDKGNGCSDVSVQEKPSKTHLDNFFNSKTLMYTDDTTTEENKSDVYPNISSKIVQLDPNPGMSVTSLQPSSLMHGYEVHQSTDCRWKINCVDINLPSHEKFGSMLMSEMPFGTEYERRDLVTRRRHFCTFTQNKARMYLRSRNFRTNCIKYAKLRDTFKLCRAVCSNNTDAVREMLSNGVSPNCNDTFKRSPLHMAACMGYTDIVKLLLDHGADPNVKDSIGNTPLHLAACTNHVAVITLLLKAGTRVSELDMAGHSPLQLAITKFNIMKRSVLPHPVLKEQVCQVILMLTEYMRRKEGPSIDPDFLNRFESLVRVSDSTEEVENNIQDLLSNLSLSSNA